MSLDLDMVVSLIRGGTIKPLMDAGIKEEMLQDEGRIALAELLKFTRDYRKVPEIGTLADKNPMLRASLALYQEEPARVLEPLKYYLDAVKERHHLMVLAEGASEFNRLLEGRDTVKITAALQQCLFKARMLGRGGKTLTTMADHMEQLKADYQKAEDAAGGMIGYSLPWPSMNAVTAGLTTEDLFIFAGRPSMGKTWALAVIVNHFLSQGLKVLVITLEMFRASVLKRIAAVRAKIPAFDMRRGRLTTEQKQRYFELIEQMAADPRLLLAGDGMVKSTTDVWDLIQQSECDVTCIDAFYHLGGQGSGAAAKKGKGGKDNGDFQKMNERMSAVVWELRLINLALNHPICATTQLGRGGDLAFSDGVFQTATGVFEMYLNADLVRLRRMGMRSKKVREGPGGMDITNEWNQDTMCFDEIASSDKDPAKKPVADPGTATGGQATLASAAGGATLVDF